MRTSTATALLTSHQHCITLYSNQGTAQTIVIILREYKCFDKLTVNAQVFQVKWFDFVCVKTFKSRQDGCRLAVGIGELLLLSDIGYILISISIKYFP